MKKLATMVLLLLTLPFSLQAARLQFALPPGTAGAQLLSGGTADMLDFMKARSDAEVRKLRAEHGVDAAEAGQKRAAEIVGRAKKAYADRLAALRKHYISLLSLELSSIRADITPSSALADVQYVYRVKNSSDRIISDITYKPLINGRPLPTTTTLVLELMDPDTLISGLGPGETTSNQGHDPEKFQFFMGEVSPKELSTLQKDFDRKFGIEVVDLHFCDQKGYKGQFKPQTIEEAFAWQLKPLESGIRQAEVQAKGVLAADAKILKDYGARKQVLDARERELLGRLKKSSVRYTATPGRKGRFVFEDVKPGSYYLYAKGGGLAVFEKVTVGQDRQKETFNRMKKDPFEP